VAQHSKFSRYGN